MADYIITSATFAVALLVHPGQAGDGGVGAVVVGGVVGAAVEGLVILCILLARWETVVATHCPVIRTSC